MADKATDIGSLHFKHPLADDYVRLTIWRMGDKYTITTETRDFRETYASPVPWEDIPLYMKAELKDAEAYLSEHEDRIREEHEEGIREEHEEGIRELNERRAAAGWSPVNSWEEAYEDARRRAATRLKEAEAELEE